MSKLRAQIGAFSDGLPIYILINQHEKNMHNCLFIYIFYLPKIIICLDPKESCTFDETLKSRKRLKIVLTLIIFGMGGGGS